MKYLVGLAGENGGAAEITSGVITLDVGHAQLYFFQRYDSILM